MNILKKIFVFIFLLLIIPFVFSEVFAFVFINIPKTVLLGVANVLFLAIYLTKHLIKKKVKSKKTYILTLLFIYTLTQFLSFIIILSF